MGSLIKRAHCSIVRDSVGDVSKGTYSLQSKD
jgi:hypothetical protein